MKKVLLGAYYFPPMASVSWMRSTKFAKYLPRFGWLPTVVTVDGRYYPRTVEGAAPSELQSLDILRFEYRRWLPTPVVKLLYPIFVVWQAWQRRATLDAVVMFGSPFYPFLFVPVLRRIVGVPVILDMRDGWSSWHDGKNQRIIAAGVNALRKGIERIGFRNACAVLFATEILRQQYLRKHRFAAEKFITVTNGFDADDFVEFSAVRHDEQNIVLLAGKLLFYTPDVAEWLLKALAAYPDWRFLYIGEESEDVAALAKRLNAETRVDVMGYLPYRQVLAEVARARLCVTTNSYPEGLGTKIFDYLALHKRVLCFVPEESEVANQFDDVPGVVVCKAPHSVESVAEGLRMALASRPIDAECVARFTREQGASVLARILQDCSAPAVAEEDDRLFG